MTRRWMTEGGGRVDLIHLTATPDNRDGWWFRYTRPANAAGQHLFGGEVRTPAGLEALGVALAGLTEVNR
jgi:hypothetical protein